eukprot:TRINITY_DN4261_c0_g2_i1.p1 TRINITY_DN4261_c0_g2~~TRINITY_DN4261_c0_g2_i1.p1  ORF type:complete len:482 (+),score=47.05 TRINITY_DN4261_c0_g2_i1:235-1680(+)
MMDLGLEQELFDQVAGCIPEVAVQILKARTYINMVDQLKSIMESHEAREFISEVTASGAVIAGSFLMNAFYGPSDPDFSDSQYRDMDIWIDASTATRGDPMLFFAEGDIRRSWHERHDAGRISNEFGVYPIPIPAGNGFARDFGDLRLWHPIVFILLQQWLKNAGGCQIYPFQGETKYELKAFMDCAYGTRGKDLLKYGLHEGGEPSSPLVYQRMWNSNDLRMKFPDPEARQHDLIAPPTKTQQGVVSSRSFSFLDKNGEEKFIVEVHFVETNGVGIHGWIRQMFDINIIGSLIYDASGLTIRNEARMLPLLLRKIAFISTKSLQLHLKNEQISKMLQQDLIFMCPYRLRIAFCWMRDAEIVSTTLFEWLKILLLPKVDGTLEPMDIYERASSVKLRRIEKYVRRGVVFFFPGLCHHIAIPTNRKTDWSTLLSILLRPFETKVDPKLLGFVRSFLLPAGKYFHAFMGQGAIGEEFEPSFEM